MAAIAYRALLLLARPPMPPLFDSSPHTQVVEGELLARQMRPFKAF